MEEEEEDKEEKQKIEDKMEMLEPTDGGKRREASRHKSMAMGLEMEETVLGYNSMQAYRKMNPCPDD